MQVCARGRKGERKTYHITISPSYHHGIWRIFIECGKKTHARKSAQGRSARGPILPKRKGIFDNPHIHIYIYTWRVYILHVYSQLCIYIYIIYIIYIYIIYQSIFHKDG